MNNRGLGISFPSFGFPFPLFWGETAIITRLRTESKIEVYFRNMEILVRVYRETGQAHPGDDATSEVMNCFEPW